MSRLRRRFVTVLAATMILTLAGGERSPGGQPAIRALGRVVA